MTEKTLWKSISKWAKTQPDVFVFKTHGSPRQRRGLPDLMGNVGTVALYVELKIETKMSRLQETVRDNILGCGGFYAVVHTLDEFKNHVRKLRKFKNPLDVLICPQ